MLLFLEVWDPFEVLPRGASGERAIEFDPEPVLSITRSILKAIELFPSPPRPLPPLPPEPPLCIELSGLLFNLSPDAVEPRILFALC